jgi:hypothetical protein
MPATTGITYWVLAEGLMPVAGAVPVLSNTLTQTAPKSTAADCCRAVELALFGDRVGRQIWLYEAKVQSGLQDTRSNPRQPRGGALLASLPSLYVPRPTAQNHAAGIYFNFTQPLNIEVEVHGRPPMSLHEPSGASILALCNLACAVVSIVACLLHAGLN